MTIATETREGNLDSKLHCASCRRVLVSLGSAGVITPYVEQQLNDSAVRHERQNKKHEMTIVLYKSAVTV